MNLATSQRPHPPPVPPRPSRQVVAEALKRTCKPPCPTRQAPPPPNVRPWRYEDQENVIGSKGGRTVVYDSGKGRQMNGEEIRCSSEPRSLNELKRPLALPRCCNDETFSYGSGINASSENTAAFVEKTEERCSGGPTQATSERNEAENQREWHYQRQQQPHNRRSNGNERRDHENSAIKLNKSDSEISVKDNRRSISDDNILAHKEKGNYSIGSFLLGRKKNSRREVKDDGFCEEKKKRLFDKLRSRNNDEYSKISVKEEKRLLDGCVNENVVKSAEIERTENLNENGKRSQRCSLSFGKKTDSQGKIMAVTKLLKTATKIEKNSTANVINDGGKVIDGWNINEEPISRKVEEEEEEEAPSGSVTTNSSDDCATVVVIDEADRKIGVNEDNDNIHHQDWLEAGIRYSSTKITLPGDDPVDHEFSTVNDSRGNDDEEEYDEECLTYDKLDYKSIRERIAMSSLQGLPPLPRSLSGFNLSEGRREAADPPPPPTRSSSKTQKNIVKSTQPSSTRPSPPGRQLTTLDTQLAILRKEMFGLRQLDLSLLSQLWSLNESIQEFRQLLQEQEDRAPSPSPSSEEGDDNSYGSHPPPPLRRPAPLLHHHRPPRPPRPLRPPTSDDSPSSEEYGAV